MDGIACVVDQVQLDLQAHLRRVVLEQVLAQHPGQHVQRAPHLVPVHRRSSPLILIG